MPKGGHAASGPPPDPNALRRMRPGDLASWTTLPREGRPGDAPPWPLTDQTDREAKLWADFWSRPQAVMWELLGQELEVAMCVRTLAKAEQPRAGTEIQKVLRQYLGSLGLTTEGMLRHRWRLGAAEPGEAAASTPGPSAAGRASSRDRLKVVRGERGA